MAITSTGLNSAITPDVQTAAAVKDKSVLGKDDFMKLLLVELQYQDPTAPMDSEKILTQTAQLAGLESADNTANALDKLTASLGQSQEFSTIAAIGKTADLGSDGISFDKGTNSVFELYFPADVKVGSVNITDGDGKDIGQLYDVLDENGVVVNNLATGDGLKAGVYRFSWDGTDMNGNIADSGVYHVSAGYVDANDLTGGIQNTKLGSYPIESVRFEGGKTLLKLGSSYIPLENIVEIY